MLDLRTDSYGVTTQKLRDFGKRVGFNADSHIYSFDGRALCSCTTMISRWFPAFDSRGISERSAKKKLGDDAGRGQIMAFAKELRATWKAKAQLGTDIHNFSEAMLWDCFFDYDDNIIRFSNRLSLSLDEDVDYYLKVGAVNFVLDNPEVIKNLIATEQTVWSNKFCVAGQIDFITRNEDGSLDLWDWKTNSTKPNKNATYGKHGFGVLANTNATPYWKYALQLSTYKFLLEAEGFKVRDLHLVWICDLGSNEIIDVPYMADEVRLMLEQNVE